MKQSKKGLAEQIAKYLSTQFEPLMIGECPYTWVIHNGKKEMVANDLADIVEALDTKPESNNMGLHLKIIKLTQELLKFSLHDASVEKPEGDALLVTTSKVFIIGGWYKGAWRTHRSRWENGTLVSAYAEKDITHWIQLPYWMLNL